MAGWTSEKCINDVMLVFIKQCKRLIDRDLTKSEIKRMVENTEFMFQIIKRTKNLDHFSKRFLSTYELDQISMILEQIISLGKVFSSWSFNKDQKLNKKISKMENNMDWISKGPVLVSLFLFLNKKGWLPLCFETSELSQSTPQLEINNREWGQGPYNWIKTELGVRKISKQFLGASEISISSFFKGTLAQAVKVDWYKKDRLLAYTKLRVHIDHSNDRTKLIRLDMWDNVAQDQIGNLKENDRVAVYGDLGIDDKGDDQTDVSYKLRVTRIERRDSNSKIKERSDKGLQLWLETDDSIDSLSKSNLGASMVSIKVKFDKGIVTQSVQYTTSGNDILLAWTYLSIPRSNCTNRLIQLEIRKEDLAEFPIDRLKKNRRVSVYGSLLTYTDPDENGNDQLCYKVIAEQLSLLN